MKKFSKLIALVLVLSLVFAFTACGKGGSDDTIKLGILCSLTGNSQTNGGYAQQGAKMAVEEINAAGGINGKQIELVIEDDGGKADTAINAYNKLQSQKVVAIVGPMLSSLALAMDQNVQTGKIPLLIGATSADANGVEYYEAGHNAGDKDLSTQILKVKEENCDVVIMWAHDDECALAARQFYEQGLNLPVISSTTIATPQVYSLCNAEWIEGWNYVTDFIAENPSELVQTFSKNYDEKYGSTPEIYAATYYNGVYAFADAAKRATSLESADLCEALKTINLDTLYGVYTANDKRELAHTAIIGVMKNLVPSYQDQVTMD